MDPATWSIIGVAVCGVILLVTVIVVSRKKLTKIRRERVKSILDAATSKKGPLKNAVPSSSVKYKPYLASNLEEYDGLTPNGLVIYDANGHPYIVPIPEPVIQSFAKNNGYYEEPLVGCYEGEDFEFGGNNYMNYPRASTLSNRSMKIALGVFNEKSQLQPVVVATDKDETPAYFVPVAEPPAVQLPVETHVNLALSSSLPHQPQPQQQQPPPPPPALIQPESSFITSANYSTSGNNSNSNRYRIFPGSFTSSNLSAPNPINPHSRAASEGNFGVNNRSQLSFANDSAYETQARSEHSISKVYARDVLTVLRTSSDNLIYEAGGSNGDRSNRDDNYLHTTESASVICEGDDDNDGEQVQVLAAAGREATVAAEDEEDEGEHLNGAYKNDGKDHDSASFIDEIGVGYAKTLVSCLKHSSDSLLYGNLNPSEVVHPKQNKNEKEDKETGYARALVSCLKQSSDGNIYGRRHNEQEEEGEAVDLVSDKMVHDYKKSHYSNRGSRMASTDPSETSEYYDAHHAGGGSSRGSISVATDSSSVYMDTDEQEK